MTGGAMIERIYKINFIKDEVTQHRRYRPEYLSDDERIHVGEGYSYSYTHTYHYTIKMWDFGSIKDSQIKDITLYAITPTEEYSFIYDKKIETETAITLDDKGYYGFSEFIEFQIGYFGDGHWSFRNYMKLQEKEKEDLMDLLDSFFESQS